MATNTFEFDGDCIILPTEGDVDLFALAAAMGHDVDTDDDTDDDTDAGKHWTRNGHTVRLTGEFRGREFGALAMHTGAGRFAVKFHGPVWGYSKEEGVEAWDVASRLDIPREVIDRAVAAGSCSPEWARCYASDADRAAAVRVLRSEEDYTWMGA